MQKSLIGTSVITLLIVCSGCGNDNPLKGDPVKLNSLSGTFKMTDENCTAVVDESHIQLTECNYTDSGARSEVTGTAELSDSLISVQGTNVSVDECETCNITLEGSATKLTDRVDSGIFSSFSGTWDGTAAINIECDPVADAAATCDAESHSDAAGYAFEIDIRGQVIDFVATDTSNNEEASNVQITGTDDRIVVDGSLGLDKL